MTIETERAVRLYTANIFKKTGCNGRVEVGRLFRQSEMNRGEKYYEY